jgi:hypothetical protein
MNGVVYLLCAGTSLICAGMLLRAYFHRHVRLLLWSGLCFAGLMTENIFLYVDNFVVPHIDLVLWRKVPGLVAMTLLLVGLVWDSN